ncbi:MAG TPA: VWA domain-containing protein, partial [Stenomitos sp.]
MISLDRPLWLWALWLLLPMGWGLARMLWRLRARKARYADPELFAEMRVRIPEAEDALRLGLLIASFACLVVAAAGPRLGGSAGGRLPGEVPSLVVALDVSKSMGVADVDPSRMEAARGRLDVLLDNLPGWRVGLVAFADDAMVLCPMTSDVSAVKTLAARLKPGHAELKQGSNLETAMQVAMGQLRGRPGAILVASDGEELAGEVKQVVPELAKSGAIAYALGVGTTAGGRIPDGQDLFGEPTYRMDRAGAPVVSRASLRTLESLAKETGGVFADAGKEGSAEDLLSALRTRWGAEGVAEVGRSLYQWPLFAGLLLWLVSTLLEH